MTAIKLIFTDPFFLSKKNELFLDRLSFYPQNTRFFNEQFAYNTLHLIQTLHNKMVYHYFQHKSIV